MTTISSLAKAAIPQHHLCKTSMESSVNTGTNISSTQTLKMCSQKDQSSWWARKRGIQCPRRYSLQPMSWIGSMPKMALDRLKRFKSLFLPSLSSEELERGEMPPTLWSEHLMNHLYSIKEIPSSLDWSHRKLETLYHIWYLCPFFRTSHCKNQREIF